MKQVPADLASLRERISELVAQLREVADTPARAGEETDAATMLGDAVSQLIDMLGDVPGEAAELGTLGEYGLHLLEDLAQLAVRLDRPALAQEIEQLCLPFALWLARRGGEIRNLAPVVNAFARHANESTRPHVMADLYAQCCELIEAASPAAQEMTGQDPAHPWRLLLLNRAIVATRSHNLELIEAAFDGVIESLPHEAQTFFAEAMEQMELIDYPDQVRDLVRRYFLVHAVPRRLH